jgi:DNA mismatch repair protein MutS
MAELTPMMQQYWAVKNEYKDCILFFRLGDFYEMFFEDAITASKELEITLTGRDCGQEERAPMCGIPFHSADSYIARLISKGYKVAICEQVEDPSAAKGIVRREVIRVITPGTVIESNMLDEKKNNYICAVYKQGIAFGLATADVSTGDLFAAQFVEGNTFAQLLDELAKYAPAEIITNLEIDTNQNIKAMINARFNTIMWAYQEDAFEIENAKAKILSRVGQNAVSQEQLQNNQIAVCAVGSLIHCLESTQKINLLHINQIKFYFSDSFMVLDIFTRRNLEISETIRERSKKGTLLWILDKTTTSMGARLIRKWVDEPLLNVDAINTRLSAVKNLKEDLMLRSELIDNLKPVHDIERLLGKIVYGTANARDLVALKNSAQHLPEIKECLSNCNDAYLVSMAENFDVLENIYSKIKEIIVDEPPFSVREGGMIKSGFNSEMDTLKEAATNGKNWLAQLENQEREQTGIKNLKIGFNKVFGYFIEVTKSYFDLVPVRYIRKQTLANCERFITPELKEMEETILGAQDKMIELEYQLFVELRNYIASQTARIQTTARIVATVDVLCSLALVAEQNNYCLPVVNNSDQIIIKEGRHPVVEQLVSNSFVPNDTFLDNKEDMIAVITGPNMAGKSTYMRQVALIVLMAQIGSFVPAESAQIGIVDRIFTRIGASDDLGLGQSTFMVEMTEVSNILSHATNKSLLVLDEIGRGTSTFDGLSIAWSVIEYIADKEKLGARTLFATHYHELTELEEKIPEVKNYCISVKEKGDDIIFLRKIIRGGADESFGIQVAKLAGVPYAVINRAKEILNQLEDADIAKKQRKEIKEAKKVYNGQVDLFNYKSGEIAEEIRKVDINAMTPVDAMNFLYRMKGKVEKA